MITVLYVEVNVICIVLLATIAVNAMSFGYDRSSRNRMFVAMTWFMAASALLDSLWCFVGGSTALPRFVLLTLNFLYFFSLCGMCYFAFLYAQESFEKNWLRRKKTRASLQPADAGADGAAALLDLHRLDLLS